MTITRNRLRYRGKSSKLERRFELLWRILNGPELVREFQFHPERKWRVDFAHIPSRTLIEIEGGIWIQGRHNRGAGFITDIEKYNEATFLGWRVFRLADVHLTLEVVGRIRECVAASSQGITTFLNGKETLETQHRRIAPTSSSVGPDPKSSPASPS